MSNVLDKSFIHRSYPKLAYGSIYTTIGSTEPGIGDHLIIHFEIEFKIEEPTPIIKRAWKHYSKENLNKKLGSVSWDIGSIDVQGYWNTFEEKLVTIVDQVAPYSTFTNRTNVKAKTPSAIKNQLSTSYNSEIWHIPTLQRHLKVKLKSASANALKICTPNYN